LGRKSMMKYRFMHVHNTVRTIPIKGFRQGELIVQRHSASHEHMDISIIDSKENRELFRGARAGTDIETIIPSSSTQKMWFQQPEHSVEYSRGFEGEVPAGQYGAGIVTKMLHIPVDIIETKGDTIKFEVFDSEFSGRYTMRKLEAGWMISKVKVDELPTEDKLRYKIESNESASRFDGVAVYEHKVDGHHTNAYFDTDGVRIWSWRKSKSTGSAIEYSSKFPKWARTVENGGGSQQAINLIREGERLSANPYHDYTNVLAGTKVRCELVWCTRLRKQNRVSLAATRRSHASLLPLWELRYPARVFRPQGAENPAWLAGRLNSKVWSARHDFDVAQGQGTAVLVVFDVEVWKGEDVRSLPYRDKMQMLDELSATYDFVMVPQRYLNSNDAWQELVLDGGREGYVIKILDQPSPYCDSSTYWYKVKNRDVTDARVVNILPIQRNTGVVDESRMGKLEVIDQEGRSYRVGSGFSDYQREWYMRNRDNVLTDPTYVKVQYDPKLEERAAVHSPVYRGVHTEKSEGISIELAVTEESSYNSL